MKTITTTQSNNPTMKTNHNIQQSMKSTIKSHPGRKALTTGIAALLLALASVHLASAQTNTGGAVRANEVTTNGTNAAATISSTVAANNSAYGFSALQFTTTGIQNTAIGSLSLKSNVLGADNTAVGYGALTLTGGTVTISGNTAIGSKALFNNTSGASNTAVGFQALLGNKFGSDNVAIGDGALKNSGIINPSDGNIALGLDAGSNLADGDNNIYIGNPGGIPGGGTATESGIIRIGFTKTTTSPFVGFHTDTYLAGKIHGDGSKLTGITGTSLAPGLALSGTTTGTFSGSLAGNASTATSAVSFSGSLAGDVTGTQGATVVSKVGAVTAANVATGANLANASTALNTANTIVRRDGSGNFSAGKVTATSFVGNGAGLTNVTAQAVVAVPLSLNGAGTVLTVTSTSGDALFVTGKKNGVHAVSSSASDSAVWGENATGTGIAGSSNSGKGIWGSSTSGIGVYGSSPSGRGVHGYSTSSGKQFSFSWDNVIPNNPVGFPSNAGVFGENTVGAGVFGASGRVGGVNNTTLRFFTGVGDGVFGVGKNGVHGASNSNSGSGVWGDNQDGGTGVAGSSKTGKGVYGSTNGTGADAAAVWGETVTPAGTGVVGKAILGGTGVYGSSAPIVNVPSAGVVGESNGFSGVPTPGYGVKGIANNAWPLGPTGIGVYGQGNQWAGLFDGNVRVNGTATVNVLTILGADLAEPFDIAEAELPKGTVVVIDSERVGGLKRSTRAYDNRVAGIVSGANGIRSAIIMSQPGVNEGGQNVALSGRVYVQADASNGAIQPGDMLTTSDTPGHAMKATDHDRAQGAIIGKAMSSLDEGTGMVLVLVTLQ